MYFLLKIIDSSRMLNYYIGVKFKKLEGVIFLKISLKELRKQKGFTQAYLATKLGYKSKSGYSMLENGKTKLSISKAKTLSKLYKIDIEKIL